VAGGAACRRRRKHWAEHIRTRIGAIPAPQRTPDEAAAYDSTKLRLDAQRVLYSSDALNGEFLQAVVDLLAGERLCQAVP
jgi:hypothetical protein